MVVKYQKKITNITLLSEIAEITMSESSGSKIPENAAVRIFTVKRKRNLKAPWNKSAPRYFGGTGFIIKHDEKYRVITNWHVVHNALSIKILINQETQKYDANVIMLNSVDDIAILEFKDSKFKDAYITEIVETVSDLQSILETQKYSVYVIGYPKGDNLSITEGIVSRLCVQHNFEEDTDVKNYPDNVLYWDNYTAKIQISAALNHGNSGGPVFNDDGKCIGIASSGERNAQNMNYIIPCVLLDLMLGHLGNKTNDELPYYRKPCPGFNFQPTEDDTLRTFFNIPDIFEEKDEKFGILVNSIQQFSMDGSELKENDIIMKIDDHLIGQNGTVKLYDQRIPFNYLFITTTVGVEMVFKIIRNKNEMKIKVKTKAANYKIPGIESLMETDWDKKWVIIGGFCFLRATTPLLSSRFRSGNNWGFSKFDESFDEELIVLGEKYNHPVNENYSTGVKIIYLKKINEKCIKNLKELNKIFNDLVGAYEEFIILDFSNDYRVIMDTKEACNSFSQIREEYNIPKQNSL